MSITNITGSDTNGVFNVTTAQNITSDGGGTSESILITGSGAIRASSTNDVTLTFTSCNIFLNNVSGTAGNPNATGLSYNGDSTSRLDLDSYIRFIDTNIIYLTSGSRRNIFVSELTRSNVIEQDSGNELFVYTQPNTTIDTCLIQGINTLEVVGQFTTAFNLTIDDVMKSYLNWEAGRLDFFGLAVLNKPSDAAQADIWIGSGASDNHVWHWNNDSTFNNQHMYITATSNRYYDGVTISWEFTDRDTGSVIEDVKMVVKDDFPGADASGTMADRGTYVSNSSGHIAGTWDSQNRTTVTTGDRNTFFMVRNAVTQIDTNSNLSGSKAYPLTVITGDQGDRGENYDLDEVLNQIEIKAYLYEARAGFIDGDTFDSTTQIGVLDSDLSVGEYSTFIMSKDSGITQTTQSTVDAYTELETLDKMYDRIKAEWYDNDAYPLPTYNGIGIDLDDVDLIVDGNATAAYAFSSGDIIISTDTGDKNLSPGTKITSITTTGVVTVRDSATINDLIINADIDLESVVDLSDLTIDGDLDISTAGTYDFSNVTVTGDVTNSGSGSVIINLSDGSSMTTTEPGTGNGQVSLVNTVPIKVTVKDAATLGLIQGARVYIETAAGGPASAGEVLVNTLTDGTGEVNTTVAYEGDQPVTGTVRKGG